MKHILFIILTLGSSAFAVAGSSAFEAAETVTWCSLNNDPVTGKPECITYIPGIGGIDSGGEGP